MVEALVIASKVKDYVKAKNLNSSGDLTDALSEKVAKIISEPYESIEPENTR